jgi:hypothetical protein
MVEILQKCLQQYSGVSILRARKTIDDDDDESASTEASKLFDKLLEIDTDSWDDEIRKGLSDDLTTQKLTIEIQKTMVRRTLRIIRRHTLKRSRCLAMKNKLTVHCLFHTIVFINTDNVVAGKRGSWIRKWQRGTTRSS